jgi:hypothetical protein
MPPTLLKHHAIASNSPYRMPDFPALAAYSHSASVGRWYSSPEVILLSRRSIWVSALQKTSASSQMIPPPPDDHRPGTWMGFPQRQPCTPAGGPRGPKAKINRSVGATWYAGGASVGVQQGTELLLQHEFPGKLPCVPWLTQMRPPIGVVVILVDAVPSGGMTSIAGLRPTAEALEASQQPDIAFPDPALNLFIRVSARGRDGNRV